MSTPSARDFLEALTGYVNDENGSGSKDSQDRPARIATVDPLYNGTGYPKVLFDGESLMGLVTYAWIGRKPSANDRVLMLPQGRGYVIAGTIGDGGDAPGTSIEGYWAAAPAGYLLENGAVYLRANYPALFSVIGTTYNTGGETGTQFRVPDSRGRTTVGKAASGTFGTLGAKMGAETHTLTTDEMPVHTHVQNSHNHTQQSHNHTQNAHSHTPSPGGGTAFVRTGGSTAWVGGSTGFGFDTSTASATATNQSATAVNNATTATNQNAGGGDPHNNVQPSIVLNRAIKY